MMRRTLALFAGLLVVTGFAVAQSHGSFMSPDHPLYGAKIAGESGVEVLSANETEQVRAKLNHASKRANESRQLAEENRSDLANETASSYAQKMQEVNDLGSSISDLAQQQKTDELITRATQHHAEVLSAVYERVPEEAKAGIGKALNQSVQSFDRARNAMEERGESTAGMNISESIPSGVRDRVGVGSRTDRAGDTVDAGNETGMDNTTDGGGDAPTGDDAPIGGN